MTAPISNGPATTRLHHYAGHYSVRTHTPIPSDHDEAGAGSRTYVRLWECGWEDVRDGCAAFLVFRAGSARTLKQ